MVLGSLGCFLVIESREHATARGATRLAHIATIATDRAAGARVRRGERRAPARAMRGRLAAGHAAVISGATGVAAPTAEEAAFLSGLGLPVRGAATGFGHSLEPCSRRAWHWRRWRCRVGACSPRSTMDEQAMNGELRQVLVTSWGHWRGEALAVVDAA